MAIAANITKCAAPNITLVPRPTSGSICNAQRAPYSLSVAEWASSKTQCSPSHPTAGMLIICIALDKRTLWFWGGREARAVVLALCLHRHSTMRTDYLRIMFSINAHCAHVHVRSSCDGSASMLIKHSECNHTTSCAGFRTMQPKPRRTFSASHAPAGDGQSHKPYIYSF